MKPAAFAALLLLSVASNLHALGWDDVDLGKVASGGAKLVQGARGLSDAEEIKLGREVVANLASRYPLNTAAEKTRYLNLVGQALVRQCDRRKIPYHFGILRTPELNAFAAPGGYILITEGLLGSLGDESELAGVLAHEISHVTQRHIAKALRDANLAGAGQDLAEAAGTHASAYAPLSDFSVHLLTQGFSRKDELEADRLGTQLAARAGYDTLGLRRSVERLGRAEKDARIARFNRTHPPVAERLKNIDRVVGKSRSSSGLTLRDRFLKVFFPATPAPHAL